LFYKNSRNAEESLENSAFILMNPLIVYVRQSKKRALALYWCHVSTAYYSANTAEYNGTFSQDNVTR